jgi:peptide-methionine (R)-S-oxide reductase
MRDREKMAKIDKTDEQWREEMDEETFHVTRQKGTERAFTGKYWDNTESGEYFCNACGEKLFESETKYDAGCGWPSFYKPASDDNIEEHADNSHGMIRTEVVCKNCDSHLGHVFPDGPAEETGLRYCINSASLDFKKK